MVLGVGAASLLALCVPFAAVLLSAGPLLAATGLEAALARAAGGFCARLVPGVPPFVVYLALTKWLQAQRILLPSGSAWRGLNEGKPSRRRYHAFFRACNTDVAERAIEMRAAD